MTMGSDLSSRLVHGDVAPINAASTVPAPTAAVINYCAGRSNMVCSLNGHGVLGVGPMRLIMFGDMGGML